MQSEKNLDEFICPDCNKLVSYINKSIVVYDQYYVRCDPCGIIFVSNSNGDVSYSSKIDPIDGQYIKELEERVGLKKK